MAGSEKTAELCGIVSPFCKGERELPRRHEWSRRKRRYVGLVYDNITMLWRYLHIGSEGVVFLSKILMSIEVESLSAQGNVSFWRVGANGTSSYACHTSGELGRQAKLKRVDCVPSIVCMCC